MIWYNAKKQKTKKTLFSCWYLKKRKKEKKKRPGFMDISILTTGMMVSTSQVESHGLIYNIMPVQTTCMKKHKQLTICLSEKAERLCISAMLWVVLQLRQTAGSAMRPRSTSTRVLNAHTWQRKNASCISGISWEVRITIPLIVMSWSISERKRDDDVTGVVIYQWTSCHRYLLGFLPSGLSARMFLVFRAL